MLIDIQQQPQVLDVQSLNNPALRPQSVNSLGCDHQITYFGVVNININERTIGSVDVWRCAICKKRFCEEKQLGIDSIVDYVGMPQIEDDEKWAVLVRKMFKGKDRWKLVRLKGDGVLKVENPDNKIIELPVRNYTVDDPNHASFLVDDYVNKAIEI